MLTHSHYTGKGPVKCSILPPHQSQFELTSTSVVVLSSSLFSSSRSYEACDRPMPLPLSTEASDRTCPALSCSLDVKRIHFGTSPYVLWLAFTRMHRWSQNDPPIHKQVGEAPSRFERRYISMVQRQRGAAACQKRCRAAACPAPIFILSHATWYTACDMLHRMQHGTPHERAPSPVVSADHVVPDGFHGPRAIQQNARSKLERNGQCCAYLQAVGFGLGPHVGVDGRCLHRRA